MRNCERDARDTKMKIADLNVCQVYEWLPYTYGQEVPEGEAERFEWLKGMDVTADTTDEEILSAGRGYLIRYAKPAARFRNRLVEIYGEERGNKIRFAEAYEICEYGSPMPEEMKKELLSLK